MFGIGCGTVDSAVTSDSRRHDFESSHAQLLLNNYLLLTDKRKVEYKQKEAGMAHLNKFDCFESLWGTSGALALIWLSLYLKQLFNRSFSEFFLVCSSVCKKCLISSSDDWIWSLVLYLCVYFDLCDDATLLSSFEGSIEKNWRKY